MAKSNKKTKIKTKIGLEALKETIKEKLKINDYKNIKNKREKRKNIKISMKREKIKKNKKMRNEYDKKENNYNFRDIKETKRNISEFVNLLKENESSKDSLSIDEIEISDEWSNNTINEYELFNAKLDDIGNNNCTDPFFSFLKNIQTLKFLLWSKNNIINYENYKSFAFKVIEKSKKEYTIEKLLPKIFKSLYEEISYFKISKIDSYNVNFFEKWSIFIKEEIDESDNNLYFRKEDKLKRLNKNHRYNFISNKKLYNYVMSRIMSFFRKDKKWEKYYYYLFLIPKNILLTYYIVLKERHKKYMYVLSDLKEFITLVLRCGGVKPYCELVNRMFIYDFDKNFGYLNKLNNI